MCVFVLGMGASGEGGARAGAGSEDGADSSGETGAARPTLRPQSRHEGDVAEREPAARLPGNAHLFHLSTPRRQKNAARTFSPVEV